MNGSSSHVLIKNWREKGYMEWLQIKSPECFCKSSEFVMESETDSCCMSLAIENGKIACSSPGMIFFLSIKFVM